MARSAVAENHVRRVPLIYTFYISIISLSNKNIFFRYNLGDIMRELFT